MIFEDMERQFEAMAIAFGTGGRQNLCRNRKIEMRVTLKGGLDAPTLTTKLLLVGQI
jgi:hypothetical protein